MTTTTIRIAGVDTVLFRDGRPFDTTPGAVASGLAVPYPSTLAGFVRTHAGRPSGDWSAARGIRFRGPLLTCNDEILLPAPADAVPIDAEGVLRIMRLTPREDLPNAAGADMPGGMLPLRVTEDVKPAKGLEWWTWDQMIAWLGESSPELKRQGHLAPPREQRVHIAIEKERGTAEEGKLFTTSMVAFEAFSKDHGHRRWGYLCQVSLPDGLDIKAGVAPLGGEQRLGRIETSDQEWPTCPPALRAQLAAAKRVRMVLATPAVFEYGWYPAWLDKTTKEGSPPGYEAVRLRLRAAAVPRRQAVSGWDLTTGHPKPVRWLAPAGSVYFFDVLEGDPAVLADRGWLVSVSDEEPTGNGGQPKLNNRNDGFGLALWGTWGMEENA
jgi:CRISPR-associated protein Cmr3